MSLYRYVANNTLSQFDPYGKDWIGSGIQHVTNLFTGAIQTAKNTLNPIFEAAKNDILETLQQWDDCEKWRITWQENRRWKKDFGLINFSAGFLFQITDSVSTINVVLGGFGQIEGKIPLGFSGLSFVGRGNIRPQGSFELNCCNKEPAWSPDAGIRLSATFGLQYKWKVDALIADAAVAVEAGIGWSLFYSFPRSQWDERRFGAYVRGYAEWDSWWKSQRRREFRVTLGDAVGIA